jgi:hypothetical protein
MLELYIVPILNVSSASGSVVPNTLLSARLYLLAFVNFSQGWHPSRDEPHHLRVWHRHWDTRGRHALQHPLAHLILSMLRYLCDL